MKVYEGHILNYYERMMNAAFKMPRRCPRCDDPHWELQDDGTCDECGENAGIDRPERLPKDDIKGMRDALEETRIETGKVWLKFHDNG